MENNNNKMPNQMNPMGQMQNMNQQNIQQMNQTGNVQQNVPQGVNPIAQQQQMQNQMGNANINQIKLKFFSPLKEYEGIYYPYH